MKITKQPYGKLPDGSEIDQYTLRNANGLKVELITYGATITTVAVPDRDGKIENVVLTRDSLADYLKKDSSYLGATVGRYANRIAQGRFTLEGRPYALAANDNGQNHLHGGGKGFDKVLWKAAPVETPASVGVAFRYDSPDGEEGYPGTLAARVTYSLTDSDELVMEYEATCDRPTIVNLTNHAYWNLAGAGAGDVLGHEVMLAAEQYLAVDQRLIPAGSPRPLRGTPMDFTEPTAIGARIAEAGGGYDHCYVLDAKRDGAGLTLAGRVREPSSGRAMEIYTTQPAVQFYTGNFLDGSIVSGGKAYHKHFGFCLETQHYPDSPNHPAYPTTVLRPGETYQQATLHRFSVE